MSKDYQHLTMDIRCQIEILLKRGDSFSSIAVQLGYHRSTISREIARNSGLKGYRRNQANRKAISRRKAGSSKPKIMTNENIEHIESYLRLGFSPEQISGRVLKEDAFCVSHETIYKHIWSDKRTGGILYKQLRHNGKRYNKRSKGKAGRGCIPDRIGIEERPSIVDAKCRLGDWEVDTIIGKGHKRAIVSIVERASKLTKLEFVSRKTAEEVQAAICRKLKPLKDFVLTITADNGKEFANHKTVSRELETNFYFAAPYHSWERGLNEHTNGLVRQYFPKGQDFDEITKDQIELVELLLNIRPRKVLNYMTPIEAFEELRKESGVVALGS
jgi:transposase, IS30 family